LVAKKYVSQFVELNLRYNMARVIGRRQKKDCNFKVYLAFSAGKQKCEVSNRKKPNSSLIETNLLSKCSIRNYYQISKCSCDNLTLAVSANNPINSSFRVSVISTCYIRYSAPYNVIEHNAKQFYFTVKLPISWAAII